MVRIFYFHCRKSCYLRNKPETRGWEMRTVWVIHISTANAAMFQTYFISYLYTFWFSRHHSLTFFPADGGVSCVPRAQSYTCSCSRAWAGCRRADDEQRGVLLLWSEGLCAGAHQCWGTVLPSQLLQLSQVRHHAQTGRVHLWRGHRWGRTHTHVYVSFYM